MHYRSLALSALAFFSTAPFVRAQEPAQALETTEADSRSDRVLRVFVLAGQSNMEGKGFPEPIAYQLTQPEYRDRWLHAIPNGDAEAFTKEWTSSLEQDPKHPRYPWAVREDVQVEFLGRRGGLTVGFGVPAKCIGPEFGIGHVLGDHFEDPVLLIKAAWGGKSLGRDFLPPSIALPSNEEFERMAAERNARIDRDNAKNPDRSKPHVTPQELREPYGHYYRETVREVRETLDQLQVRFPNLEFDRVELSGLVWFQGWNDQFDDAWARDYGTHLAALIRDLRKDLEAPDLPAVIGKVGFDGPHDVPTKPDGTPTARTWIKRGQQAVADLEEFRGRVRVVDTAPYWDMEADAVYRGEGGWSADPDRWRQWGNDRPYHYYGSPWFFAQAGRGFGEAMLELLD